MRFAMIAAAPMALLLAFPVAAQDDAPLRRISVVGQASVTAEPDEAHLTLGASARRESAADASEAVGAVSRGLVDALRALGVDEADIRTARLSLAPVFERPERDGPTELVGYAASARYAVHFTDLDLIGPALDAALEAGATDFGGVRFDVSGRRALERSALREAMADARAVAELLAEEAGETLGAPLSIAPRGAVDPARELMRANAVFDAASAAPVAPGRIEIEAAVSVVYRLD